MKKIVTISIVVAVTLNSTLFAKEDLAKDIKKLQKDLKKLKRKVTKIKRHNGGDNVKFSIDLRSSYDKISYNTSSGADPANEVLTNRFVLHMVQQPVKNLVFKGQIVVNKYFGQNNHIDDSSYNNYDWFATVTPDDDILRLREANFIYFGSLTDSISTTFSIGRRPSLDGNPGYIREGNKKPASPTSHNINMEFDGFSWGFRLEKITGIEGMNFKICGGRGYSNAYGKYNFTSGGQIISTPAAENKTDTPNMDMLGFIWKAYDDSQYKISINYAKAVNLLGSNKAGAFQDVGDMITSALTFEANGIGDEINDFLDDARFFASYAQSTTLPKTGAGGMLGSTDSQTGSSMWAGFEWEFLEDTRVGIEYNRGSRYWRSFTYGEDTLIGSKLAARGEATELYVNRKLVGNYLSIQLRHTQINYDYTGSDMFFGVMGTPEKPDLATLTSDPVKSATDTRVSIRYRY